MFIEMFGITEIEIGTTFISSFFFRRLRTSAFTVVTAVLMASHTEKYIDISARSAFAIALPAA
jgi:hypothetical protein